MIAGRHVELLKSIGGARAMGAMLRRVRADQELSREDLAGRIGRPVQFVAQLESGTRSDPDILTATLLARGCEVGVSLLVASFALPREDPLPWPRERRPPGDSIAGPHALGATLRELRLGRDWSQFELAALVGTHPRYLAAIERGVVRSPHLLTVTRLGRAFATTTPGRIAHTTQLAQSYAGEIEAPPLRRLGRDSLAARKARE